MSHTPGPWIADLKGGRCNGVHADYHNHDGDDCYQYDRDDFETCPFTVNIVETDSGYYGPTEEDARLIAAAPDMLDACHLIVRLHNELFPHGRPLCIDGEPIDHSTLNAANYAAERAIKKAEGR